jgi:two-component system, cell cycle sensor histidine kinase and response regulator CckA
VASTAHPKRRLVLVVDDEAAIVRAITAALSRAGFQAVVAENGAAGLETFLIEPNAVDLVLADVVMPVMDGLTMVQEIRKKRPDIPVVFMSGYPDKMVTTTDGTKFQLIRKPFLIEYLLNAVTEILAFASKAKGNRAE